MSRLARHITYIKKGRTLKIRVIRLLKALAWILYLGLISDIKHSIIYGFSYLGKTDKQKQHFKKRKRDIKRYGKSFLRNRKKIKDRLAKRDGPYCRTCLRYNMHPQPPLAELTIDHIVRVADGGTNDLDNLQLLCVKHHRIKDDPK